MRRDDWRRQLGPPSRRSPPRELTFDPDRLLTSADKSLADPGGTSINWRWRLVTGR